MSQSTNKLIGKKYYDYWTKRARKQGQSYVGRRGMSSPEVLDQGSRFWHQLKKVLPGADQFQPEDVVTEFGCGWGRITRRLAERYPQCTIYGIDIVAEAIVSGKGRFPMINFIRSDHYPIDSPPAKLVVTCTCLQHITDSDVFGHVVRSFHKMVLPGGWLVMLENATTKKRAAHLNDLLPQDYVHVFSGFDFQDPIVVHEADAEPHVLLHGRRLA